MAFPDAIGDVGHHYESHGSGIAEDGDGDVDKEIVAELA